MPEPQEPRKLRKINEVLHVLEDRDQNIVDLREWRRNVTAQFENHQQAITEGYWAAEPYQLPDYLPFQPQSYPIDIIRHGELISRHPNQFPHLPSRYDVPGVVKLTLGDLDAAAEWEMLPQLTPDSQRQLHAEQLRQHVEDVTFQAIMRRFFLARLELSGQLRDPATLVGYLPIYRAVLSTGAGMRWRDIATTWKTKQAHTMITPEFFLRPDHRQDMAKRLLAIMKQRSGVPYYAMNAIDQAYQALYGQWDTQHP